MAAGNICQPLRKHLARAGVASVQEVRLLLARGLGPRHWLCWTRRATLVPQRRCERWQRHRHRNVCVARDSMDAEVVGLDGESLLDLELVGRIGHAELEPLEHGNDSHLSFLPGEGTALFVDG